MDQEYDGEFLTFFVYYYSSFHPYSAYNMQGFSVSDPFEMDKLGSSIKGIRNSLCASPSPSKLSCKTFTLSISFHNCIAMFDYPTASYGYQMARSSLKCPDGSESQPHYETSESCRKIVPLQIKKNINKSSHLP